MRSQSNQSIESNDVEIDETQEPVWFNWKNRWLKGHEYAHILRNVEAYCSKYGIEKYASKMHPAEIYDQPVNGTIYFVQGTGLGTDFGFPRVTSKKKFRWKKMNFPTHLPKKNPKVTYIVASTTNCNQINQATEPIFRMHVVTLFEEQSKRKCGYLLCHILQIKKKNTPQRISSCAVDGKFDFYRLFACLHNVTFHSK